MARKSVVVAAAVSTLGLAAAPAVAQAPRTLTFKEISKGSSFAFVDNPPRAKNPRRPSFSAGDGFVISIPLVSTAGAHRGTLRATCTVTAASKSPSRAPALCYGVFAFKEGQLVAVVSTPNVQAATTSGTIIGGAGAYSGARGTFKSVTTKSGANDTITLTG